MREHHLAFNDEYDVMDVLTKFLLYWNDKIPSVILKRLSHTSETENYFHRIVM